MRVSWALPPLIFALTAGLAGCKRSSTPAPSTPPEPPTPTLGSIAIHDVTPDEARPEGAKLDPAILEARVRERLLAAKLFAPASGDAGAPVVARVRIEVALEDVTAGDKGAARAAIRLRIDTRPSEVASRRWDEDVQAGSESQYDARKKAPHGEMFQKLVTRTLDDLVSGYVDRQRLWVGAPGVVSAAMKADAGDLRLEAIRAAGERRLTSEVPTLLALLDDGDESVRDAALGALVDLRERRAVGVLAAQRSMRDRREMRKILDAIAVLGGDEANQYLSFVAEGHDDPEIRAMAAEAKARLARHAGPDAGH